VLEPRARRAADEQRLAPDRLERAHGAVDAARKDLFRSGEQTARARSVHSACSADLQVRRDLSMSANDDARPLACVPALVEHDAAVDDHRLDAGGILK